MRAHFQAELLLNRHGVLTKGAAAAEGMPGGFAMLYKVLTAFEDAGRCQRGYFVESLGGAQFAVASTVDRLRSYLDGVDPERREYQTVVLAAADPANPYGGDAAVARGRPPAGPQGRRTGGARRRANSPGSSSAADARCSPSPTTPMPTMPPPGRSRIWSAAGRVQSLLVEKINGEPVLAPDAQAGQAAVVAALTDTGFARTPRGLRLR